MHVVSQRQTSLETPGQLMWVVRKQICFIPILDFQNTMKYLMAYFHLQFISVRQFRTKNPSLKNSVNKLSSCSNSKGRVQMPKYKKYEYQQIYFAQICEHRIQ